MKEGENMIARVEIEGLDRSGKDTLVGYIDYMSGRMIPVSSRGLMSTIAYADVYNRFMSTESINKLLDANKETLVVYLTADRKDLELRHKISHHEPIDFDTHEKAFQYAKELILSKDILFYEFNTTEQTPYQIAEMVCTIIEEENKK